MFGINLELTTSCPLHCPQCYCTLEGGRNIDINIAKSKIKEASEHGVKIANLSGGESLCYPHLFELIEYTSICGIAPSVAISGYNFNSQVLKNLIEAGIGDISISLNGSTAEINSITRDGYDLSMEAIKLLGKSSFEKSCINWVMHSNNVDDFVNIIKIAEENNIKFIDVISFKPDAQNQLNSFPSGEQIRKVAYIIKNYNGPVNIQVETCFSQMLAVVCDTKLFGNFNVGANIGCGAGIRNYNINIDGFYSPCRHLSYFEDFQSLDDYLKNSEIIKRLSVIDKHKKEPCASCRYEKNCRPCPAVNDKINNEIYIGHDICSLWR